MTFDIEGKQGTAANRPNRIRKGERKERIIAELRADPYVRIAELSERFGVTPETVRRDLDELSRSGMVSRTYGGAALLPMGVEPSLRERHDKSVDERTRIGEYAAGLIEPGEVLMIDAGSTTLQFARRLAADGKDLTVITNCYSVAFPLAANPTIRVVMCPGVLDVQEGAVAGPEAIEFLQIFRANKAVIGASGLTSEGPSEVKSKFAWIKRAMIKRSQRHVLLIDGSKFDQPMLEVVCPLTALDDVVVDRSPEGELREALDAASVRVHVAGNVGEVPGR